MGFDAPWREEAGRSGGQLAPRDNEPAGSLLLGGPRKRRGRFRFHGRRRGRMGKSCRWVDCLQRSSSKSGLTVSRDGRGARTCFGADERAGREAPAPVLPPLGWKAGAGPPTPATTQRRRLWSNPLSSLSALSDTTPGPGCCSSNSKTSGERSKMPRTCETRARETPSLRARSARDSPRSSIARFHSRAMRTGLAVVAGWVSSVPGSSSHEK